METNKYSGADRNIQIARHDSFRGSRVSQQEFFLQQTMGGSGLPEKHEADTVYLIASQSALQSRDLGYSLYIICSAQPHVVKRDQGCLIDFFCVH